MKANSNNRRTNGRQISSSNNTALAAVAFQDHLMRNLSLTDPIKKRQINHRGIPKKHLKEIKSVVDTGRQREKRKDASALVETEEKEYVLDQKPQPLTLAQKLGLIEAPGQLLSDLEWRDAKEKSNRREDSILPCVICKEEFGLQQQVLLCCSHVFHRNCLQAFERFTGKKTCPMCRKEQYQTRVIHEGAKMHRVVCVTRIQACWRGYVVRCWYRKLRQTVPPKDPRLRKKFYEEKLEVITERLLRSYDTQIDAFLAEMDRSITASRDVFQHLEASNLTITHDEWDSIQLKAVERGKTECPICIMPLLQPDDSILDTGTEEPIGQQKHSQRQSNAGQMRLDVHSDRPRKEPSSGSTTRHSPKVTNRIKTKRCAGTKSAVGDRLISGGDKTVDNTIHATGERSCHRRTVLLSCTHVFHLVCLEAFEELSMAQATVCPVCRSAYQKKVLSWC